VQLEENTRLSIHDNCKNGGGPFHIRKCAGYRLWVAFTYAASKHFFEDNYTVIDILFTLLVKELKP